MLTNEENLLKERIRHLLHVKKCPIARLGDNDTMRARLGRQINGEAQVPFTTLQLILSIFPDVSADWLVVGEGSMLKTEHFAQNVYTQHNEVKGNKVGGDINVGQDTIVVKDLQEQIEQLQKDNEFLKGIIRSITQK